MTLCVTKTPCDAQRHLQPHIFNLDQALSAQFASRVFGEGLLVFLLSFLD